jgi:hypothetical protein
MECGEVVGIGNRAESKAFDLCSAFFSFVLMQRVWTISALLSVSPCNTMTFIFPAVRVSLVCSHSS